MTMTTERLIDYDALLHDAFRDAQRGVMRTILTRVAEHGLPGEHHFYISFNTLAPGVSIAPRLLQKYPGEMTIVLQHRFWDLFVQADRFEVKLTFDSIRERLVVPFAAVRVFFDPSVHYGLQFDEQQDGQQSPMGELMGFSGGRAGVRATGRTQAERGERPTTERKKSPRKTKAETVQEMDNGDATEVPRSAKPAAIISQSAPAEAVAAAKTGPRLVESANDSDKVVSLDKFRKK